MKFVLISMLSAIAFVSQTESLLVDQSERKSSQYLRRSYFFNIASQIINQDVPKISWRVSHHLKEV